MRRFVNLLQEPVWSRITTISVTLFFIFIADAILSFWVPNFLQDTLKSPILMGWILSFSSIVGIAADFFLPQLLKKVGVRKLLIWSIITSVVFSLTLIGSIHSPYILLLLLAMALWGIYYEFIGFANQQFVSDGVPHQLHSAAWAIIGTFKSLAYTVGPILGGLLVLRGEASPAVFAIVFVVFAFWILLTTSRSQKDASNLDFKRVHIVTEIKHWRVLFFHIWPIILLSIYLSLIDSTFWTTGAVFTEKLARENPIGALFLPLYMIPSLIFGLFIVRKKVHKGKKKWALKFTFAAGLFLAALFFSSSVYWQLLMVFISSSLLSFAFPLIDGSYSDIIHRMGQERNHLIGLTSSTSSLAYIIGPVLAGYIVSVVGDRMNFVVMGVGAMVVSFLLLMITPKKLKLPQQEIQEWSQEAKGKVK